LSSTPVTIVVANNSTAGPAWTWVAGSSIVNRPGDYGTKGVAVSSNVPGARYGSVVWIDNAGALWVFGGRSIVGGVGGFTNDLWKFDRTNWIWISGTSTLNQSGSYGTKGVSAPSNVPGGREFAVS